MIEDTSVVSTIDLRGVMYESQGYEKTKKKRKNLITDKRQKKNEV